MTQENRKVYFFDTTLRDGEQSPGCSMNLRDKLHMAEQLELLRVDVIEAGFAAASPGDFEAVAAVAKQIKNCTVASLSRSLEKDIDRAWEAISKAARPRIHIFLATSPLHMQYKLRMSPEEVFELAIKSVKYARTLAPDVQFSLEDASRSEADFRCRVVEGVINAGATVVNIPDTVGYAIPEGFAAIIRDLRERVPNISKARLAVHCHNDLGLAVANTLSAIHAGAEQAECTLNGIGERAGNAALEEIVMALKTREDFFGLRTDIDTTRIYAASRSLQNVTGTTVQPNKAIVGDNAFAHESGIHQHGMMAHAGTYEIMTPASIGVPQSKMVLGKHSGRHAFEQRLKDMGFHLDTEALNDTFAKFKVLADRKKVVSDADIAALVSDVESRGEEYFKLDRFNIQSGNVITPTGTVRLKKADGEECVEVAIGDGPIDAAFQAIDKIVKLDVELVHFALSAITGGEDAQGSATVRVRYTGNGQVYNGRGVATDIVEAAILAYIQALNHITEAVQKDKQAH